MTGAESRAESRAESQTERRTGSRAERKAERRAQKAEKRAEAEARRRAHPPSPPWVGAVLSLFLLASVLWLLAYTLLDWDWQQSLGGWNWLIIVLLSTVTTQGLQRWHNDPRRYSADRPA